MTVAELIASLSAYPHDMRVLVEGYESGYDDPSEVRRIIVEQNWQTEKDMLGMYDPVYEGEEAANAFEAVVIPR